MEVQLRGSTAEVIVERLLLIAELYLANYTVTYCCYYFVERFGIVSISFEVGRTIN